MSEIWASSQSGVNCDSTRLSATTSRHAEQALAAIVQNLTCERVVLAAGGARAITASIDKHAGDARVVEAAGAALRRMTYVAW